MPTIVMQPPRYRSRDRWIAAVLALGALAVPSTALADEGIYCVHVSPGRVLQVKVPPADPNDPTPIILDQLGPDVGRVGVALLGTLEAGGTTLIDGGSAVIRTAAPPDASPSDWTVAVTVAVADESPAEAIVNVTSGGGASEGASQGSVSASQASDCVPDERFATVAPPAVSIADVVPGGGLLPAGSVVAVVGSGFQPDAQVNIEGVLLSSTSWVDSSRIEVVTSVDAQLDGRMVTVTNPDSTGATSYASLRTTDLGASSIPLLASTVPIFPLQTQSSAVFAAPAGGTFFAVALQNPGPDDSVVSVDLWDADAGSVVASATITLPPLSKVSREVVELFPDAVPGAGAVLMVTATIPVQMLGISGNQDEGSVTPVLPALASP